MIKLETYHRLRCSRALFYRRLLMLRQEEILPQEAFFPFPLCERFTRGNAAGDLLVCILLIPEKFPLCCCLFTMWLKPAFLSNGSQLPSAPLNKTVRLVGGYLLLIHRLTHGCPFQYDALYSQVSVCTRTYIMYVHRHVLVKSVSAWAHSRWAIESRDVLHAQSEASFK